MIDNKNHSNNELDLSEEKIKENLPSPYKKLWHPDKAKMRLAYSVLIGIFCIFVSTFFINHFAKIGYVDLSYSISIFEICKTGLLPIVTLILGYYFSKN